MQGCREGFHQMLCLKELKEKTIDKDGKRTTCQEDVREADLFINGKESRYRHENSRNI
jgi:hypothetical protein